MFFFGKNNRTGGFMDEIRCDEPSYLIWKWHPEGSKPGDNSRENAIRCGSSLRVKDGEVAVFVYKQKSGSMQDFIIGPYDKIIKTENFPVLSGIVGLAYEGGTPFQAEVYFINVAQIIQTKFAVPFFDVYDPRFADFDVPLAVRGTISFKIENYWEFIKLNRLSTFNINDFQTQIRDTVSRYVKNVVASAPVTYNIPLIQIETKISQINETIEHDLKKQLKETFGVEILRVDLGAIELDKSSEGYHQLMSVTKDIVGATAKAEGEAKIKNISDKQRIESQNYEEILRIQREEGQYATHKQTQSANIDAFQIEKQAEVGISGANALGQMGTNKNSCGSSEGFNIAAMMADMAVGSSVGQNIACSINNMMSGIDQSVKPKVTPPNIPESEYYVAANGKATGPFNFNILKQMAINGQLFASSLVWRVGMSTWVRADSVEKLKGLFKNTMPPIPPNEK